MAKARSSTVTLGSPGSRNESVHVSVRKIDNGFIVSSSKDSPKGYRSSETFHATKPKLNVNVAATRKGK